MEDDLTSQFSDEYVKRKEEFLEQLKNLNPLHLIFYWENFPLSAVLADSFEIHEMEWLSGRFGMVVESLAKSGIAPLQGIDLDPDGVKHVNHSDLRAITHHIGEDYLIGKTMFGRFLSGKDVTVKTWDLPDPATRIIELHPERLRNELMLLTSMSHPNLPRLIAYSIDKQLAVVYHLNANETLRNLLTRPGFGWDERMEAAVQFASLMEYFHNKGKTIGSIDPQNIIIDEDNNIKLCEFGLCGIMDKIRPESKNPMLGPVDTWWRTGGIYSCEVPELARGVEWTTKCDIYAFGCLLLELITKEPLDQRALSRKALDFKSWAQQQFAIGKEFLVDKCFVDDDYIRSKITRLVMNCMRECPDQRAEAKIVAKTLKDLKHDGIRKEEKVAAKTPRDLEEDSIGNKEKRLRTDNIVGI